MALAGLGYAVLQLFNFLILWGGIYFLTKWIPGSDDMPIWKAGVIAAAIYVASWVFNALVLGAVSPA